MIFVVPKSIKHFYGLLTIHIYINLYETFNRLDAMVAVKKMWLYIQTITPLQIFKELEKNWLTHKSYYPISLLNRLLRKGNQLIFTFSSKFPRFKKHKTLQGQCNFLNTIQNLWTKVSRFCAEESVARFQYVVSSSEGSAITSHV